MAPATSNTFTPNNVNNAGSNAADIISYIGIPLAVLGILPVFYVAINTIVTSFNVRRHLRRNAITQAVTRSSMLSGIIEIEFPIYRLTPLARRDEDYGLSRQPSLLKGGSWSLFNWKKMVTGRRSYRISYSSDMREPQAEINFDELLSFMLDRGAVPDRKGVKLLNMAGLWTPANTSILLSPDGTESALRVAFPDDSDGVLSLALQWRTAWETQVDRMRTSHWIELKNNRTHVLKVAKIAKTAVEQPVQSDESKSREMTTVIERSGSSGDSDKYQGENEEKKQGTDAATDDAKEGGEEKKEEYVGVPFHVNEPGHKARLHVGMEAGRPVIDDYWREQQVVVAGVLKESAPVEAPKPLEHLQEALVSRWFPVLCTAFGMMSGASIFLVQINQDVIELCTQPALPCGVLVLAGILRDDEVPSWATEYPPDEDARAMMNAMQRSSAARMFENSLPPAQREMERRKRENEERHEQMQQMMSRARRARERQELREREAMESSKMITDVAAAGVLRHMNAVEGRDEEDEMPEKERSDGGRKIPEQGPWRDIQTAAETFLYNMLINADEARKVCQVLDRWKTWTQRGGMNREDFYLIMQDNGRWLCHAIVLMAMLKEELSKEESSVASDLQECIRTWKTVKLG